MPCPFGPPQPLTSPLSIPCFEDLRLYLEDYAQLPVGEFAVRGERESLSAWGVRRVKAALSSGCKSHPANSLQPEAIGAVMEVTKWLKPSISVSRIGDSASVQAAT